MLTFYFTPGASSMATHIALHEVGAPFESRLISLTKHENRTPEYLALNPEGKVPTLVYRRAPADRGCGEFVTWQSSSPLPACYPERPRRRSRGRFLDVVYRGHHPSGAPDQRRALEGGVRLGGAAARPARLGDRALLDRGHPSVPALLALLSHVEDDTAGLPALSAHYDRMMARPAVKRTCEIEAALGYELP